MLTEPNAEKAETSRTSGANVIVAGARTPMGRLLGALKGLSATDLGGIAIKAALERAGVAGEQVAYLVMGQVLQAGAGQNPARSAGLRAGLPATVPSMTVNKVCLSGLAAIATADQLIRAGQATIVVAGGMESMSQAPHLLRGSRTGFKYGDTALVDHMAYDGLWDQATDQGMGQLTESWYDAHPPLSREDQDAFAARSHRLAAAAQAEGRFDVEMVPIEIPGRTGEPVTVSADEGVRPQTDAAALAALKPAFGADGTITAGTASQISDGAAAVVVMPRATAAQLGLDWIAEIGAYGTVAGPDSTLQLQPSNAIAAALRREGRAADDLDLVEINEAFAAIAIESTRALGIDPEKVNVDGGAIAIGHPIGASGARIALHLALELRRRGGGLGAAALCGGGGQGDALLLRVPAGH